MTNCRPLELNRFPSAVTKLPGAFPSRQDDLPLRVHLQSEGRTGAEESQGEARDKPGGGEELVSDGEEMEWSGGWSWIEKTEEIGGRDMICNCSVLQ